MVRLHGNPNHLISYLIARLSCHPPKIIVKWKESNVFILQWITQIMSPEYAHVFVFFFVVVISLFVLVLWYTFTPFFSVVSPAFKTTWLHKYKWNNSGRYRCPEQCQTATLHQKAWSVGIHVPLEKSLYYIRACQLIEAEWRIHASVF